MCSSSGGQNCITQPLVSSHLWVAVSCTGWERILCDDTRGCVMQFWLPDDEHMCSKHVEAWNKTYCKTKILCIKLVNYWDKYSVCTFKPPYIYIHAHINSWLCTIILWPDTFMFPVSCCLRLLRPILWAEQTVVAHRG